MHKFSKSLKSLIAACLLAASAFGIASGFAHAGNVKAETSLVNEGVEPANEIVFWSTKAEAFAETCADFEAETGIKVNGTYQGNYDDMVTKITAAIATDTLPNVAQLGQRHGIAQMWDSGKLLPIEEHISPELIEDILPGFWKRFTYKDTKVILPFQNSMPMLYMNKTVFDDLGLEVPTTMDEVREAAKTITDETDMYGFTLNSDYPWYILALMYNSGVYHIEDGHGNVNRPEVLSILQTFSDMVHVDGSMLPNQHQTAQGDFTNGTIAMIMTSCASYKKLIDEIDGKFELQLGMFPEISTMDITMGGNGLGLFAGTPEEERAAALFVEYMLDAERVAQNTLDSGYIPVTNAATATEIYKEYLQDPNRAIVDEQLQYLGGAPVMPTDSLVWGEFNNLLDLVEADPNVDISSELEMIDEKLDKYLEQYQG